MNFKKIHLDISLNTRYIYIYLVYIHTHTHTFEFECNEKKIFPLNWLKSYLKKTHINDASDVSA